MKVLNGDCRNLFKQVDECSVDAIVTDPPYELGFMGKAWDASGIAYDEVVWREALRVLKPGGHLLAFGGSRTYHRMACAIEDAGFEVRDQMMWLYGSGFPKSLDVSKAIDKQRFDKADIYKVTAWVREARDSAGISNKDIDAAFSANGMGRHWTDVPPHGKQPAVPTLEQVPQLLEVLGVKADDVPEDIARLLFELNGRKGQPGENWFKREVLKEDKRMRGSTSWETTTGMLAAGEQDFSITAPATDAAQQWQGWGTALKPAHEPIVVARKPFKGTVAANVTEHGTGAINIDACRVGPPLPATTYSQPVMNGGSYGSAEAARIVTTEPAGRWPANVILDEEAGALLDEQSGKRGAAAPASGPTHSGPSKSGSMAGAFSGMGDKAPVFYADTGGASRFFYCAKASRRERNAGVEQNHHPTVKPIDLMRYLVRLVTPKGGLVLDPFTGSGTTGIGAVLEGMDFLGFEQDPDYAAIADARIGFWQKDQQMNLDLGLAA